MPRVRLEPGSFNFCPVFACLSKGLAATLCAGKGHGRALGRGMVILLLVLSLLPVEMDRMDLR